MPATNGTSADEAGPSRRASQAGASSAVPSLDIEANGTAGVNGGAPSHEAKTKRTNIQPDVQDGSETGQLPNPVAEMELTAESYGTSASPKSTPTSAPGNKRTRGSSPAATSSEASTSRHQSRQPRARGTRRSPNRSDALRSDALPSGAVMSSLSDRQESTPPLDAAERERFHFQATSSPSSHILAHGPPSLPYDLSYPPLSPMGTDQAGHSIALRHGNAGVFGAKDAKNGVGAGPSARGPLHGHLANGHERPKKVLRGEEHEKHMVSEATGSDAMPWGLKTTLMEKSRHLPRGKTRMGTQKRNAPRNLRAAQGGDDRTQTPQLIKVEEEVASEMSSPMLPTMEIEGQAGDASGVPMPAQSGDAIAADTSGIAATNEGIESTEMDIDARQDTFEVTRDNSVSQEHPLSSTPRSSARQQKQTDGNGSEPGSRSRRGTAKMDALSSDLTDLTQQSIDSSDAETSQLGDGTENQSQSGPSRRPRAAHKRLTLMGGYYGRGKKQPADLDDSGSPKSSPAPSALADKAGSTHDESRAASETTYGEEATTVAPTILEEGAVVPAIVAGPSTPVKASQQPSLALGLRESATKRQTTKLHAGTRNDDDDDNNAYCETCNGSGHFICCDGCPRSFHFACINPPLDIDELPSTFDDEDDQWFCNVCRARKRPTKAKRPKGVWGPLLQRVEDENPTIFSLPADIRNYFKGVATATDGSYVDSSMLKPVKVNKNGIVDGREDPLRLKDKNGKLILCYRCGQSALPPSQDNGRKRESMANRQENNDISETERSGWRKLIGCDFCSLYWHLDCLDPPLASMPSSARKWMCPNHVEHVMRPERVPKNAANSQSVHDLPLPSDKSVGAGKHYRMRVVNDGRIDIIPDPMDTYFGSSGGLGGQDANGHVAPAGSIAGSVAGSGSSDNRGRGLERGWDEIEIPGAQGRAGTSGATSSSLPASASHIRFKYRLPEKVIRVDFWTRAELERQRAIDEIEKLTQARRQAPLDLLAAIANAEKPSEKTGEQLRKDKAAELELSAKRARELVAQAFGSGALFAHPARPAEDSAAREDQFQIIAPDPESVAISALRDTYEEGEFEREFLEMKPLPPVRLPQKRINAKDADKAALETTTDSSAPVDAAGNAETAIESNASAADESTDKAKDEAASASLNVDANELAQLRALKQLVQYRGADALLDFVLK